MSDFSRIIRIIDKAIGMEKNARKFYNNAALYVDSEAGKKVLIWMAEFEKGHVSRLESRRKAIIEENNLNPKEFPVNNGDVELSEVSSRTEIKPQMSDTEIIMIGISNEERAHDYYQKKLSVMPEGPLRELFETLMKEEERHIKILTDQHKHLEVNRIWGDLDQIGREFK